NMDPASESRALYEQSYSAVTAGGETAYAWLDKWFGDLASKYIDAEGVKAVLLAACDKNCNNLGDVYGKTSDEYMMQLRGYAQTGAALSRPKETKAALIDAHDVAAANSDLPLLHRLYVYNDLIHFCQASNDAAGVKKYSAEMAALSNKP